MKRSLFTSMMLLMGVLSLPMPSLSAAQLKNGDSSLIAKGDEIHHKWFLRFNLNRPVFETLSPVTVSPIFGHFQVALRDPEGELVFHRTYSFETLPVIIGSTLPLTQTIKIHEPIKGQYTLYVTLLDRKMDSGAFDPTAASSGFFSGSNYFSSPTLFDEHNTILLKSSTGNFIPNVTSITKPTDPKVTGEQTFTLHFP